MDATIYYEVRLPGSDYGKPTDPDSTGCDLRVYEWGGQVHLAMRPARAGGDPDKGKDRRYIGLLNRFQVKELISALEIAMAGGG